MQQPELKISSVEEARLPVYATDGSVGMDCFVRKVQTLDHPQGSFGRVKYYLGFCLEMPLNIECQVRPKSSIHERLLLLSNAPGTVDPDYREEVCVIFYYDEFSKLYKVGDACCQIVFNEIVKPRLEIVPVEELSKTTRIGGYGSTKSYLISKGEVEKCMPMINNLEKHGLSVTVDMTNGNVIVKGDNQHTVCSLIEDESLIPIYMVKPPFKNEGLYCLKNIFVEIYKDIRHGM